MFHPWSVPNICWFSSMQKYLKMHFSTLTLKSKRSFRGHDTFITYIFTREPALRDAQREEVCVPKRRSVCIPSPPAVRPSSRLPARPLVCLDARPPSRLLASSLGRSFARPPPAFLTWPVRRAFVVGLPLIESLLLLHCIERVMLFCILALGPFILRYVALKSSIGLHQCFALVLGA